jgi:hypothetical protein
MVYIITCLARSPQIIFLLLDQPGRAGFFLVGKKVAEKSWNR